jgi:hypothetical protein
MKELTDEQFDELKSHSQMLGVIGMYVEDFCSEEDTVLVGVLRLLAKYHSMKAAEIYVELDKLDK